MFIQGKHDKAGEFTHKLMFVLGALPPPPPYSGLTLRKRPFSEISTLFGKKGISLHIFLRTWIPSKVMFLKEDNNGSRPACIKEITKDKLPKFALGYG